MLPLVWFPRAAERIAPRIKRTLVTFDLACQLDLKIGQQIHSGILKRWGME
jgi:hypothetical protein